MVLATWAPAAASAQRARSPWTLVTDPTARSVDVDRRTAAWIALADEMPVQLRAAAIQSCRPECLDCFASLAMTSCLSDLYAL